jgi:hypothetical protein
LEEKNGDAPPAESVEAGAGQKKAKKNKRKKKPRGVSSIFRGLPNGWTAF